MSKGAQELLDIVKELYPHQKVVTEHNVADSGALYLDIFLPQLNLAFEYDGIQHFVYNKHFHGTKEQFIASKKRDAEKNSACASKDITLIRVRYDEKMTKELIVSKIEEALDGE